jgi:two-component system, LytTR family, sensor kinase
MNPWKPSKIEWITFFLLMPVLDLVLNSLLFGPRFFSHFPTFIYGFVAVYLIGFVSWYLHIASMHLLRVTFPEFSQTPKRVVLLGITHLALVSLSMVVFFYGFDAVGFLGYKVDPSQFRLSLLVGIFLTMIATTLWEGQHIFIKYRQSLEEKEQLEQLKLQNEFDSLKSQVNPHFLFNCFNTLSSLITEDPDQAEKFLNELSKVYRYLLKSNEDGLTTLQNELKFIRSYFELLKTRHGEAVQIQFEVDKKYEQYLLPSLSLQLLVENAVKHNVISRSQPLVIDIFTTAGNKLVVNNNLQRKVHKAPSNKIGIENIRSKYDLLAQPGFQVVEDARNFTVVLPLMWNNISENKLNYSPAIKN